MNDNLKKIINAVELAWIDRAEVMIAQGTRPASMNYINAEVEFFMGAAATLHAIYPPEDPSKMSSAIPPLWVINPQAGRLIVDRYRVNRTSSVSMIERANVIMFNSHGLNPRAPSPEVLKMAEDYITGKDGGQFLSYVDSLPKGE